MTTNLEIQHVQLEENQIEDIINFIIEVEVKKECKKICSKSYYKNQYLKYAVEHHSTLPCIVRTYAELLKSGYLYTKNKNDVKHANKLISYLNVYRNKKQLDFIDTCFKTLETESLRNYKYLAAKIIGRLKSFRSLEAKLRLKLLKSEILPELLKNIEDILISEDWIFKSEELEYAKQYLEKLQEKNNFDNPIRDLIGYRIIVDSFNISIEEENLINFIYDFIPFSKTFFEREGFDISESKDYIKNPKNNNYQSYHYRIEALEIPVELQIRTFRMHDYAEYGKASHDTAYKNTILQNFMRNFLYEISGEKVHMNEDLGFLKEMKLPNHIWCFTPNEEIPTTPAELKNFSDLEFLASVFIAA